MELTILSPDIVSEGNEMGINTRDRVGVGVGIGIGAEAGKFMQEASLKSSPFNVAVLVPYNEGCWRDLRRRGIMAKE